MHTWQSQDACALSRHCEPCKQSSWSRARNSQENRPFLIARGVGTQPVPIAVSWEKTLDLHPSKCQVPNHCWVDWWCWWEIVWGSQTLYLTITRRRVWGQSCTLAVHEPRFWDVVSKHFLSYPRYPSVKQECQMVKNGRSNKHFEIQVLAKNFSTGKHWLEGMKVLFFIQLVPHHIRLKWLMAMLLVIMLTTS